MWTRVQLKSNAKRVLEQSYLKAFVAALVLAFVTGGYDAVEKTVSTSGAGGEAAIGWLLPFMIGELLSNGLIWLAVAIMVFPALEVGCHRFYLEATQFRFDLRELGYAFAGKGYINIILTMLLRSVYTILWLVCFIIPGIVKYYAYSMVPYLLAENPNISPSRAIAISNQMTRGHKMDMFILDISFLGWILLGALALGIGLLFVNPYIYSTNAQLYLALRSRALEFGITSLEELTPPQQ